jgi:hypothetical protein
MWKELLGWLEQRRRRRRRRKTSRVSEIFIPSIRLSIKWVDLEMNSFSQPSRSPPSKLKIERISGAGEDSDVISYLKRDVLGFAVDINNLRFEENDREHFELYVCRDRSSSQIRGHISRCSRLLKRFT